MQIGKTIRSVAASWRQRLAGASRPEAAQPDRRTATVAFDDLAEMPDPAAIPPLDRPGAATGQMTAAQQEWRRDGVLILRGFIPEETLEPYRRVRAALETEAPVHHLGGYPSPSPYEHVPEMRAVCLYPPLMRVLEEVIGEPMMLHLALTGWVSTERNWHQDDYLNPDFVNSWYAAVWIALDTIDPDAGPFEYIPGSHRWPLLRGEKVRACMPREAAEAVDPLTGAMTWPKTSEAFVVPAIEAEIIRRGAEIRSFTARSGDVLVWHGRLMHRGSAPRVPGRLRKSLIAHYSGVTHRPDMPERRTDSHGSTYAVFGYPLFGA